MMADYRNGHDYPHDWSNRVVMVHCPPRRRTHATHFWFLPGTALSYSQVNDVIEWQLNPFPFTPPVVGRSIG